MGTTGFVKPVSATAYLDSIKTEINFAKQNGFQELVFTIGNSSLQTALKNYKKEQIVEIGNFVYDSVKIAQKFKFQKIILICGEGKMSKIAQGFKNTHNRFGGINFKEVEKWTNLNLNEVVTMKRVYELIPNKINLDNLIILKVKKQFESWLREKIEMEITVIR